MFRGIWRLPSCPLWGSEEGDAETRPRGWRFPERQVNAVLDFASVLDFVYKLIIAVHAIAATAKIVRNWDEKK